MISSTPAPFDDAAVDGLIVAAHADVAEPALEGLAADVTVELVDAARGLDEIVDRLPKMGGDAGLEDLGDGAAGEREDGRPAGHRLDHDQAERLRPVDREHERARAAEKRALLPLVDLADELDSRLAEERPDDLLEVDLVGSLGDLRGDLERHARAARDLDGAVATLLGRDPAEERQIVARGFVERVEVAREAVVDGRLPVHPLQREPLGL